MSSPDLLKVVHTVPLDFPFYLSCPIDSYHATYTWTRNGARAGDCQRSGSDCLHLIPAMEPGSYGGYQCISQERDHTRVLKEYQLMPPEPERQEQPKRKSFLDKIKIFNGASQVMPRLAQTAVLPLMLALVWCSSD